jgi:CubicO group peptidase (beta-lactamase class C family)
MPQLNLYFRNICLLDAIWAGFLYVHIIIMAMLKKTTIGRACRNFLNEMVAISMPVSTTLDTKRWQNVLQLVHRLVETAELPAVSLCVGVADRLERRHAEGRFDSMNASDSATVTPDTPFLVASLTKPVTVMAVMMLVERGLIRLNDRISDTISSMNQPDKNSIRIRHLMSHTSGLPDMLPDNDQLRAAHAPLSKFIERIGTCELLFEPGTGVSYQSMGTALLSELVQQVSGQKIGDFLKSEIFEPLGMNATHLGVTGEDARKVARIRINKEQAATNWNWNSPYWLGLGAPWGGMTSTASDLGRLGRLFLGGGVVGRTRLLSDQSVALMSTSQMGGYTRLAEDDRRLNTWGLGWRIFGAGVGTNLGELLSPEAFGHHGATGTLMWMDPARGAYAVILTTRPYDQSGPILMKLSNAISAAFVSE